MLNRSRRWYSVGFFVLLAAEFAIGLFVHDRFIRPYFGDVLIVILLYMLVRFFLPRKAMPLAAGIFLFAVVVELTQILPLVDVLGIRNRYLRVLMGNSFAWGDIVAYLAGSVVNLLQDVWVYAKARGQEDRKNEKTSNGGK